MRSLSLLLLPLMLGCDSADELIDVGSACITAEGDYDAWDDYEDGNTTQLLADAAAIVTVVLAECESGSFEFEDVSCTVTEEGGTLTVTSSAIRIPPKGGDQTDDCNVISVECDTPALAAGDWSLSYGGGSAAFTVPHDGEAPCAEGADYPSY